MEQPSSGPIPVPLDFPVHWDDPADERLFWTQDRLHFPDAMTPLDFSIIEQVMDAGFNAAMRAYDIPIAIRDLHINTYLYVAVQSADAQCADTPPSEAKLRDAIGNLQDLWERRWLPELQEHRAYWEAFDLRGATMPALLAHLHETEGRLRRAWEIHFLLFCPMLVAIGEFTDGYQDLFDAAGPFDAYALLGGFESKTVDSGRLLWELSRTALASPVVRQVCTDNAASDVVAVLSACPEGQAFLADLDAYLALYGQQQGDKVSLNHPFWIEDPTPAIRNLQAYITQPNRDVSAEMAQAVARREEGVARVRERLHTYPLPVVEHFEFLLKAAQVGYRLKEEHIYWLDATVTYQTRRLVLEIGQRLAHAGIIEGRDDVFYLHLDEVQEAAATPSALDRRAVIKARQAMQQQFAARTPPPALGTLPSGPPPDSPVIRMFFSVEGDMPPPSERPDEVRGNAGSPGVVQGVAKVVRVLADAAKLAPGDILVAVTTAPAWTPLFGSVGAVVTDSGGILSHCAVVAREYGIPAVVGTGVATTVIQDGQTIEVDGNAGVVRILCSKHV